MGKNDNFAAVNFKTKNFGEDEKNDFDAYGYADDDVSEGSGKSNGVG